MPHSRKRLRISNTVLRRQLVSVLNDHVEEAWNDVVRNTLALPGWAFRGIQPSNHRAGIWEAAAFGKDPWTHSKTGRNGTGYTPGAALRSLSRQLVRLSVPIEPHKVLAVEIRDVDRCAACGREVVKVDFSYIHGAKGLNPDDRQATATKS